MKLRYDEKSVNIGIRAENFFISNLNRLGIPYNFVDDWYDFEVCGEKVEVKCTQISVIMGKKPIKYGPGRYDFTKEENREKQFEENVWVCFILKNEDDFLIQGICKARDLDKKRYIPITEVRGLKPMTFDKWIRKINTRK